MTSSSAAPVSTGLLSQSISNLQSMSQQIAAISGLPSNAASIQSSAQKVVQQDISAIQQTQKEIQQFTPTALTDLEKASNILDSGANLDQVKTIIQSVNTSAATLKKQVDTLNTTIITNKNTAIQLSKDLAPIENVLHDEISNLNVQLQSAQQEASAIRSKEKYFLALGIFGLAGLAAAGIALAVEEKKVNDLESKASNLRAQISRIQMLVTGVNDINTNLSELATVFSDVQNAVDFVSSDISEIINDLDDTSGGIEKAKIFITTTIGQVKTLATDAS